MLQLYIRDKVNLHPQLNWIMFNSLLWKGLNIKIEIFTNNNAQTNQITERKSFKNDYSF